MTANARWPLALAAFLFAAAPVFADDPAPDVQALATRYVAATGGSREMFAEQSYIAAGVLGDTPASHAHQLALEEAVTAHGKELDALDAKLSELVAHSLTAGELRVAVAYLESPAGRSATSKKRDYFGQPYAPGRTLPQLSDEEVSAFSAYNATPEGIAIKAKSALLREKTAELAAPVQKAISKSAEIIYCHQTRQCVGRNEAFDEGGGPMIRE